MQELTQAWVVEVCTGEYEDRHTHIKSIFLTEESAKAYAERYNQALIDAGLHRSNIPRLIGSDTHELRNKEETIERFGYMDFNGQEAYVRGPYDIEP